jgi:hypothetical protein
MTRTRVLACVVGGAALFLGVTESSAGILVSGLEDLKAAAPRSRAEKVHEGKGGMHQNCLRHAAPGAYPDCHWHHFDPRTGQWYNRRRLLDGTNCPANDVCPYDSSGARR